MTHGTKPGQRLREAQDRTASRHTRSSWLQIFVATRVGRRLEPVIELDPPKSAQKERRGR